MEISNFTFIITDDCNFDCSYCFQKKEKKTINETTIERAVDFFHPFFNETKTHVAFYGGEPLLAFDRIEQAVTLLLKKNETGNRKLDFSLTTNGTLINQRMLDFFNRHQFSLILSFDGLAQDAGRKNGTKEKMLKRTKQIRTYPDIYFEINSVFSPHTVSSFSQSMRFLVQQSGATVTYNIATQEEWDPEHLRTLEGELERLSDFLSAHYKETGTIPVKNFRFNKNKNVKKKGIFRCGAAGYRMSISPEGDIWGCSLFHDYFKTRPDHPQYKDFFFGTLEEFIKDYEARYPQLLKNYVQLRQDHFKVEENFCFLCEELEGCMTCPVNAAYSTDELGQVSSLKCALIKIQSNARKKFVSAHCN